MMPLLLFLRDNDNNQGLVPGAALGNIYMTFLQLQSYYQKLTDLHAPHKRGNLDVEKLLYNKWEYCHNIMHFAAMILNPQYCDTKLTQNKDVMADLFALIDRWGPGQQ